MAGSRKERNAEQEVFAMLKDCEWMQDDVASLEVRSAVAHDAVVMSLAPYLLALSLHDVAGGASTGGIISTGTKNSTTGNRKQR